MAKKKRVKTVHVVDRSIMSSELKLDGVLMENYDLLISKIYILVDTDVLEETLEIFVNELKHVEKEAERTYMIDQVAKSIKMYYRYNSIQYHRNMGMMVEQSTKYLDIAINYEKMLTAKQYRALNAKNLRVYFKGKNDQYVKHYAHEVATKKVRD